MFPSWGEDGGCAGWGHHPGGSATAGSATAGSASAGALWEFTRYPAAGNTQPGWVEQVEHIAYSIFAYENFFFTVLYRVFHMIWMNKILTSFSRALKKAKTSCILVYQLLELPALNHMKQPVFSERERIKLSSCLKISKFNNP